MKTIFLFVTIVAALVSSKVIVVRKGNDALWNEFKRYFNKTYSEEEDAAKKPNWERSLEYFLEHNRKFYNGEVPYSIGINQFTDMSDDEFMSMSTGLANEIECNSKSMIYVPPSGSNIPDNVDWYQRGYVTEVINQGACGACWAFCSVAALEGQHKRRTGKLVKLSEQQLIDCSTITGNKKCAGGQMCRAYEYAVGAGGVDYESAYPFQHQSGPCRFKKDQIGSTITGYLEIPYGDESALHKAVGLIGPVAAGLDASLPNFRHYKSGIFEDPRCSNTSLNHALTIVGYGTENGKDYWLVKNSWGKHWGMKGFGKIARNNNNQCGIASKAIFPVLSESADGTPMLAGHRAE